MIFEYFSKNCRENQVLLKSDKNEGQQGTSHEEQYTFVIVSRSVILRMKHVSDKSCTENQNTHIMFDNVVFENCAVYEIMWENAVERGRLQTAIWRMRVACCMPKATDTHSQYVILIAFTLQQWLHENTAKYYVLRTVTVLFMVLFSFRKPFRTPSK